jgi:hypothetical protein
MPGGSDGGVRYAQLSQQQMMMMMNAQSGDAGMMDARACMASPPLMGPMMSPPLAGGLQSPVAMDMMGMRPKRGRLS